MNDSPSSRRRFLQDALSFGAAFALPGVCETVLAADTGRVFLGFQSSPPQLHFLALLLDTIRPGYRPDLGDKVTVLPGASGSLAIDAVARSPLDGSTVLISPSSVWTLPSPEPHAIDPADALVPVAAIGAVPFAFMVGPAVPATVRTMPDYLRWVHDNPGRNGYGVPGLATDTRFIGTELSRRADVALRVIGYRGPLALFDDLVSGAVPAALTMMPSPEEISRHPVVRPLAVVSSARIDAYPNIATLAEHGLAMPTPAETLGFFMRAGTAAAKVAELEAAVRKAVQSGAVLESMATVAMRPPPHATESYERQLTRERATWKSLLADRIDHS